MGLSVGTVYKAAQRPSLKEGQNPKVIGCRAERVKPFEPTCLAAEKFFCETIQQRLAWITGPAITSALDFSQPYAALIRAGRQRPHPRHWLTLARLVGNSSHQ